ncbi:MAG: inositol monophosphatase [Deltaproteobacteria bacterium]|nr:inositol monophosphatase [Deltaproteobacteria bacterium]
MNHDLMTQAENIVRQSGHIVLDHWDKPRNITRKGRIDLVTDTDLAVEAFLKEALADILPGSAFLAEETSAETKLDRPTWIIDPVDGTTNFAHGVPFVATSVALWQDGQIVLGLVNMPIMGELFIARAGQGAFLNGRAMAVSSETDLASSLVATGFPYSVREDIEPIMADLKRVLCATQGVRRPGAAAGDLAWVACGRYDAFYEIGLKAWDTAAGILLVTEAGGQISTFDPDTPYRLGDRTILASNSRIHRGLAGLLQA